jgi:hypothetical protein
MQTIKATVHYVKEISVRPTRFGNTRKFLIYTREHGREMPVVCWNASKVKALVKDKKYKFKGQQMNNNNYLEFRANDFEEVRELAQGKLI